MLDDSSKAAISATASGGSGFFGLDNVVAVSLFEIRDLVDPVRDA